MTPPFRLVALVAAAWLTASSAAHAVEAASSFSEGLESDVTQASEGVPAFEGTVLDELPAPELMQEVLSEGSLDPGGLHMLGDPHAGGHTFPLGPFSISVGLRASFLYDDNVAVSSDNKEEDFVHTFQAILAIGTGDLAHKTEKYISLLYRPTLQLYSSHSELNSLDHDLSLEGKYGFSRSEVTGRVSYVKASEPNRDAGSRLSSQLISGSAGFHYSLSPRTSFEVNASAARTTLEERFGSTEFTNREWFNYELSAKVTLSVGGSVGWLFPENGDDQMYEGINFRVRYDLASKLIANASGGVEWRQFEGSGGSRVSPVFDIGIVYAPDERTSIDLSAYRRTTSSAVIEESNFEITGVRLTAARRLPFGLFVSLLTGYENASYYSTSGDSVDRDDNYFFIRPSFGYNFRGWEVGVFYFLRDNDSSSEEQSFVSNQYGLNVSWGF